MYSVAVAAELLLGSSKMSHRFAGEVSLIHSARPLLYSGVHVFRSRVTSHVIREITVAGINRAKLG